MVTISSVKILKFFLLNKKVSAVFDERIILPLLTTNWSPFKSSDAGYLLTASFLTFIVVESYNVLYSPDVICIEVPSLFISSMVVPNTLLVCCESEFSPLRINIAGCCLPFVLSVCI